MQYDEINGDNYIAFAIENYDNRQSVTIEDFNKDLNRFNHVNKLLKKYSTTGKCNYQLLINHLIILYNIFNDAATPLLFFKVEEKNWPSLSSFLYYINRLPIELDYLQKDQVILENLKIYG